jgi:hypothetical protein
MPNCVSSKLFTMCMRALADASIPMSHAYLNRQGRSVLDGFLVAFREEIGIMYCYGDAMAGILIGTDIAQAPRQVPPAS